MKNYHIVKGKKGILDGWLLIEEGKKTETIFSTTKAGCIKESSDLLNYLEEPASVKIHKEDGKFEEERTYPRTADPKKSKG